MKRLVLEVRSPQSYVEKSGQGVKPGCALPLRVPLDPGGYLELAVDEAGHLLRGQGRDIRFTTDMLQADPSDWITGQLQQMELRLSGLEYSYDPMTGDIVTGGGYTYVQGIPNFGGAGALALWYLGPSRLQDGNSPSFDLSDGLGCSGGLLLEAGSGNPTDFVIHLETDVVMEDADGDGVLETECWSIWKRVKLLYRPPELRVILPEIQPEPPRPCARSMYDIRVSALIDMAERAQEGVSEARVLARIEMERASDVGVLLCDRNGSVVSGDLSGRSTKTVRIQTEDHADLTLGLVRGGGSRGTM